MIFNDEIIFIHIGKTAGMSCSRYLLHNLKPPVYNCHNTAAAETEKIGVPGVIPCEDIKMHRHSTLTEALQYIEKFNGKQLEDFRKVFAVIRHPFSLEFSVYNHLKKPHVKELRKDYPSFSQLAEGPFIDFIKKGGYHRPKTPPDQFFRLNGEVPANVELIRFEEIAESFPKAVAPFVKKDCNYPFPLRNVTHYKTNVWSILYNFIKLDTKRKLYQRKMLECELTDEAKELIINKYKYMFDSGLYSPSVY